MQAIRIAGFRKDIDTLAKRIKTISVYYDNVYKVSTIEHSFIVAADNEQDALDALVDNNLFDYNLMSDEDYQEYSANGWDDSYMLLGNASEPFWCESLHIEQVI